MHKFSVWTFSDREIDQIVQLVEMKNTGAILPIDRRRYTKQVLDWATNWNILEKRDDGRLYFSWDRFDPCYNMPIEALWRMCKPIVEVSTGFSMTKHRAWESLSIYPATSRHYTDRDMQEQMDILNKLAQYGYLIFQHAGTVWQITRMAA